jgi:hypothetical protein
MPHIVEHSKGRESKVWLWNCDHWQWYLLSLLHWRRSIIIFSHFIDFTILDLTVLESGAFL